MQKRTTLILSAFALLLSALTFLGSAGGVANVQKLDMTGSPVSVGVCANCHLNNAFSPSVDLKVLSGEQPVTKYVPGQTYTLQVVVKANANASTFGFQAVALNSLGIGQAGTFQNAPFGTSIRTLNGRSYPEQTFPSLKDTFRLEWVAPAAGFGDVRLFAAGVASNGNGSSSGDGAANTSLILGEDDASSLLQPVIAPLSALQHGGLLEIRMPDTPARITLFDLQGRPRIERQTQGAAWSLPLDGLSAGLYLLHWQSGESRHTLKVMLND